MTFNIAAYWNQRYLQGRTSGEGSEGDKAIAKARYIDRLILEEKIDTIADWGAGDGHVLSMIRLEADYLGIDISRVAVDRLRREYHGIPKRRFLTLDEARTVEIDVDLAMSLDVIFHCIDDLSYEEHLRRLFGSSHRFVLIHSLNENRGRTARHVRWRRFTDDVARIAPEWVLMDQAAGPSEIGFYLYRKDRP